MPWVTPADPPDGQVCFKIWLPYGVEYEAAATGAILQLAEVKNWEQVDGEDEQDTADFFTEAFNKTILWERCMPTGAVIFGGWDDAPDNFLLCDGASYSTTTYAELFAVIGYKFGGAGGNFNVPQIADKMPIGKSGSKSIGDTGGAATHQLTEAEMPSHSHNVAVSAATGGGPQPIPSVIPNIILPMGTSATGGDNSHNNMPPWLSLNAAIAYR